MSRVRAAAAAGVARITLDRADKRNALDLEMVAAIHDAVRAAAADAEVRVVLIDAAGADFCAGADLAALAAMLDAGAAAAAHRRDAEALGQLFIALRELPKPVVAAVHGRALAGGLGLATACDIVLAHEDARLGYPEVQIGFVPAMVMTLLRRAVGEKRAFELVATGRSVTAREALDLGLVSRVLPAATFDAEVNAFAARLAALPPQALRLTKRLFYALDTRAFDSGIALGAQTNVEARATPEFAAGVRRFTGGRREGA
jgi:methylglutaconyl-CoA hydratase